MNRLIACLIIHTLLFAGCKKIDLKISCSELKEAIQTNNVAKANSAITGYIKNLSSDENTAANLQQLAASISGNCSLTAQVSCFNCIYTLPAQSEIQVTLNSVSPAISKTIDISYDSKNRMKFVNMHD